MSASLAVLADLACENGRTYTSPEIGTIIPLRSEYSEDGRVHLVKKIADLLERKGLINDNSKPHAQAPELTIRLDEYVNKRPVRRHENRWIDGGRQLSIFHPETGLPFFLNISGSEICRLCNGKRKVGELLTWLKKEWRSVPDEVLVKDLMKFLFLLEELDLVELVG